MLKDAMIYLEKKYNINIDQNIDIQILSSKSFHEKIGREHIISNGYDSRAVGIAVKNGSNKSILIENEAPYFREMSVLIHELTHIWQFDNLDIDNIEDSLKVLEGHAMYVELEFLKERFPEQALYIDNESKREDVYGVGYRYIDDMLTKEGISNPFLFMKK